MLYITTGATEAASRPRGGDRPGLGSDLARHAADGIVGARSRLGNADGRRFPGAVGMAIGALSRNGHPYELLMLVVGYAGMQGAAMINVIGSPEVTLRWHLLGLPIALIAILAVRFMPHREESSS